MNIIKQTLQFYEIVNNAKKKVKTIYKIEIKELILVIENENVKNITEIINKIDIKN